MFDREERLQAAAEKSEQPVTTEASREPRTEEIREGALSIPRPKEDRRLMAQLSTANHKPKLSIPKEVVDSHREAGWHIAFARYRINGDIDVENLSDLIRDKGWEFVPPRQDQVLGLVDHKETHTDGSDIIVKGDSVLMRTPLEPYLARLERNASRSRMTSKAMDSENRKKGYNNLETNKETFETGNQGGRIIESKGFDENDN